MSNATEQQQVFTLSWLANGAGAKKWTEPELSNNINNYSSSIGNWNVVWGPYYFIPPSASVVANTMYVAQSQQNPDWYVIAIAGTNMTSSYDWLSEDLNVTPIPWPYANNNNNSIQLTTGDNQGLTNLLNLTDSESGSLQNFLFQLTDKSNINLSFTGHSLGGALSPLLVLALMDPSSSLNKTNDVSINNWQSVSLLATAGPSPGNQDFVTYFNNFVTNNNQKLTSGFIWNSNDVVPHAWNYSTLSQLTTNFYDLTLDQSSCIYKLLSKLVNEVENSGYTQFQSISAFSGQIQSYSPGLWTNQSKFLAQAIYQHINAYVDYFDCTWITPPENLCQHFVDADKALVAFNDACNLNKICSC